LEPLLAYRSLNRLRQGKKLARSIARNVFPPVIHHLALGIVRLAVISGLASVALGGVILVALPVSVAMATVTWNILGATVMVVVIKLLVMVFFGLWRR